MVPGLQKFFADDSKADPLGSRLAFLPGPAQRSASIFEGARDWKRQVGGAAESRHHRHLREVEVEEHFGLGLVAPPLRRLG